MILLYKDSHSCGDFRKVIFIFGAGLVGREIVSALSSKGYHLQAHNFHWTDRQCQARDAANLIKQFRAILYDGSSPLKYRALADVSVVWAAGRAGFTSSDAEMIDEKKSFQVVLDLYWYISTSGLCNTLKFHLVSSAGGLFESQKFINRMSVPSPCRPYGTHKLELEKLLLNSVGANDSFIYRPSSVYGLMKGGRLGLIATLVKNGVLNKEVKILGNMDTLRDYVFSGDIGKHIANRILSNVDHGTIEFLASGRPTSILQLKIVIEQLINKKIYICSSASNVNREDITFDVGSLPIDWCPTEINVGVRKVYADFF